MKFEPHKPGQGAYARWTAGIALSVIALAASVWLYRLLIDLPDIVPAEIPGTGVRFTWGLAIAMFTFVMLVGFTAFLSIGMTTEIPWLRGLDNLSLACVDFLIETETELRKVSWPTREELMGSSAVVIFLTLVLGVFLLVADSVIQLVMKSVGVL